MKVVVPLAGLGTRLRPHTLSRPKPLVSVAGKAVLGHVLDRLAALKASEYIFITGYLGEQIEDYVRQHYRFPARFVDQRELKGQAHAIWLARDLIDQPIAIVFVDTIVEVDLSPLEQVEADGAIFVKEVADPRRFGVAVLQNGYVTRLVEKPKEPVSNLAVVGVYYLRNHQLFLRCIDELIQQKIVTGGEYYLADALQLMIDHGARLRAFPVEVWEDTGTPEALLQTNRYLLSHGYGQVAGQLSQAVIIPPVYIARSARIVNSIVGPNVSIADRATISHSIIREAIVNEDAVIAEMMLSSSLIGGHAEVRGSFKRLNVGDFSRIALDQELDSGREG
ncbi:MAG: NTP transferase domain-containing protein [Chloroflexi bacterium]|nr:NTP transferase domain-containing protein [Chloroflexota bacterium]